METGLGSAFYCLQLEYLHLYSHSKRTQLKERNKQKSCFTSANLESVCGSSTYFQLDINPFYLYPRRKLYLSWASFSLLVWSLSLLPAVVTQDSQECQTFVTVTLMYANYWGSLLYEFELCSRVHVKSLLTFCLSKIRRGQFSPKEIQIYGYPQSLSLNSSYFNTDFKNQWENWEIHKMMMCTNVWLWGNCTRNTHINGLDFYLKTFKDVKSWIYTGTMFPEVISNHFCHYLSQVCFLIL